MTTETEALRARMARTATAVESLTDALIAAPSIHEQVNALRAEADGLMTELRANVAESRRLYEVSRALVVSRGTSHAPKPRWWWSRARRQLAVENARLHAALAAIKTQQWHGRSA